MGGKSSHQWGNFSQDWAASCGTGPHADSLRLEWFFMLCQDSKVAWLNKKKIWGSVQAGELFGKIPELQGKMWLDLLRSALAKALYFAGDTSCPELEDSLYELNDSFVQNLSRDDQSKYATFLRAIKILKTQKFNINGGGSIAGYDLLSAAFTARVHGNRLGLLRQSLLEYCNQKAFRRLYEERSAQDRSLNPQKRPLELCQFYNDKYEPVMASVAHDLNIILDCVACGDVVLPADLSCSLLKSGHRLSDIGLDEVRVFVELLRKIEDEIGRPDLKRIDRENYIRDIDLIQVLGQDKIKQICCAWTGIDSPENVADRVLQDFVTDLAKFIKTGMPVKIIPLVPANNDENNSVRETVRLFDIETCRLSPLGSAVLIHGEQLLNGGRREFNPCVAKTSLPQTIAELRRGNSAQIAELYTP